MPRWSIFDDNQRYEKSRAEQKKLVYFLCRDGVSSMNIKDTKKRVKYKGKDMFFFLSFPSGSIIFICKDGKKR